MATEIEAKFVIPDAGVFRRLKTRRWLAGFRLGERKICRVLDTYLDTKERLLMSAGMAFRVRRQDDGQVWLTLKEMKPATGAVHRREELEFLFPAGESGSKRIFAARALPEGPVRNRLLQVVGRKRLIRLATVRQRRTIRPVAQDGDTVALLSLDAVQVRAGGAVERFSEVEVELTGHGGDGDLDRLATCLEREWGLRPEVRSKLERALAAIDAGSKTPAARKGLGIDPADSMAEAARRVLAFHLSRMLRHEQGAREGRDVEALHDMRVATRRMRAALRVFAPYLDPKAYRPFRRALRRAGRTLGAVRDLDVFREKTERYLQTLPEEQRPGLDSLLAAWQAEYDRAREAMLALLDGDEYRRFAKEFERFLETPGAGAGGPADQEATQPRRVRQAMPALVVAGYAAVRAYEDWATGGDPPLPRFHELRIASKRLRYTLEFFREVLPSGAGLLIERITELQDHLGNLQDAVVACEILRHFLAWGTWGAHRSGGHEASPAAVAPGVAIYLAARHAEIRALVDGFPAVWAKVADAAFRRRLFAVVSAL